MFCCASRLSVVWSSPFFCLFSFCTHSPHCFGPTLIFSHCPPSHPPPALRFSSFSSPPPTSSFPYFPYFPSLFSCFSFSSSFSSCFDFLGTSMFCHCSENKNENDPISLRYRPRYCCCCTYYACSVVSYAMLFYSILFYFMAMRPRVADHGPQRGSVACRFPPE